MNNYIHKNIDNYKFFFTFSIWIWVLTYLYNFNIINFSPLYLSLVAVIFTSYINIFTKKNSNKQKLIIVVFEIFIFALVLYKHLFVDKNNLFIWRDMVYSSIIFGLYLLFLYITKGTSFLDYYFNYLYKTY